MNSFMNYIGAQYLSPSSGKIKKALVGMAIGLALAVFVWGGDGLIEEFKRGSAENAKRKEEEAKA